MSHHVGNFWILEHHQSYLPIFLYSVTVKLPVFSIHHALRKLTGTSQWDASAESYALDIDGTTFPCIIKFENFIELRGNAAPHLLHKLLAEGLDALRSNDTTVGEEIADGVVGDLPPGMVGGAFLEFEGGSVIGVVAGLEGSVDAGIQWADEEGGLGSQCHGNDQLPPITCPPALDVTKGLL